MLATAPARAAALGVLLLLAAVPAPASAARPGVLEPLAGPGACITVDPAVAPGCRVGRGFGNPSGGAALSPLRDVLAVPQGTGPDVALVRRDTWLGRLRQAAGPSGCLTTTRDDPRRTTSCRPVRGIAATAEAVAWGPRGRTLFVVSDTEPIPEGAASGLVALAVLERAPDGALRQPDGPAGCVASAPLEDCAVVPSLGRRFVVNPYGIRQSYAPTASVSLASGDRDVYVGGSSLTLLRRAPGAGWRAAGCVGPTAADGCAAAAPAVDLSAPRWTAGGRVGIAVAVAEGPSPVDSPSAVVSVRRDPATGALSPALASCWAGPALPGCRRDRRLSSSVPGDGVALTGRASVLVGSAPTSYGLPPGPDVPFSVAALRLGDDGALRPVAHGCVSSTARRGCVRDRRLSGPSSLGVSASGRRVVVASGDGALVVLRRDGRDRLRPLVHRAACSGRGCRGPWAWPQQVLVPGGDRNAYVLSSSTADTGTIAGFRLR